MCLYVVYKGANGRAAEVRGDLEGREAAAGVDGSRQSWFLLISSQLTVRKHSQGLLPATWLAPQNICVRSSRDS